MFNTTWIQAILQSPGKTAIEDVFDIRVLSNVLLHDKAKFAGEKLLAVIDNTKRIELEPYGHAVDTVHKHTFDTKFVRVPSSNTTQIYFKLKRRYVTTTVLNQPWEQIKRQLERLFTEEGFRVEMQVTPSVEPIPAFLVNPLELEIHWQHLGVLISDTVVPDEDQKLYNVFVVDITVTHETFTGMQQPFLASINYTVPNRRSPWYVVSQDSVQALVNPKIVYSDDGGYYVE